VGKHRYRDVKHADKFIETLSEYWAKAEPYVIRVGIVMGVAIVAVGLWLLGTRLFGDRSDASWEERFQMMEEAVHNAPADPEAAGSKILAKMDEFAAEHRGEPATAVTLLELAQGHERRAAGLRDEKPKEAREELQKAASAAEQLIADFPGFRHVATAHYEAGKARLELGEWERAAEHFEKAAAAPIPSLAALAKWQAGYCYEQLGRLAQARLKYEELRVDPAAGWCAEQAEFALAQLGRRPPKAPQATPATPKPSSATPAPSK